MFLPITVYIIQGFCVISVKIKRNKAEKIDDSADFFIFIFLLGGGIKFAVSRGIASRRSRKNRAHPN